MYDLFYLAPSYPTQLATHSILLWNRDIVQDDIIYEYTKMK